MFLSAVSVLVVGQSSSEIPEGLTNNPVYIIQFMCFIWIWEQTAIVSPYSINWLVFITENGCLLRGTDGIFIYNSGKFLFLLAVPWFRCLVADLSLRRLVFDPRAGQVGLAVDKMSLGRIFLRVFRFYPITIIPPKLRNHLNLHFAVPRSTRIKSRSLGTFQKAIPIPKSGIVE